MVHDDMIVANERHTWMTSLLWRPLSTLLVRLNFNLSD